MLKMFDGELWFLCMTHRLVVVEIIITKIQNIHKHAQLYMKDIQLIIMVIQMARKRNDMIP